MSTIIGGPGNNSLSGGNGKDTIKGKGGDDTLDGGNGNDTLIGGIGRDDLTGGSGKDVFLYGKVKHSREENPDVIRDFSSGDTISLAQIDANTNQGGNQDFTFIGSDPFSGKAGELRFSASGVLQGDVNGDGNADFAIELQGVASLDGGDLIL